MAIPRPEYPRPQLVREPWVNLNGRWEFEFDFGKSGRDRKLMEKPELDGEILVPFCPESALSGIGYKDFIPCAWYRRDFDLPAGWGSGRVILHFGAVDYRAEVYINGQSAGIHEGGYTPFSFDITKLLHGERNSIALCAEDDTRSGRQPAGKQSDKFHSHGCSYTRTTGIWQTVWAELVPDTYIKNVFITPDVPNQRAGIRVILGGAFSGGGLSLSARAFYDGKPVGAAEAAAGWNGTEISLPISELHLWEAGNGRLYDLELTLSRGENALDSVKSYFGMRSVDLDGNVIKINGRPLFQRLILDQGFYPDGIYTARDDSELKNDILRSMAMGFNGARLHEKIFEPRFLYWADRQGYLCWGEHANWLLDVSGPAALQYFLPEWTESIERDYSHPAIVGWCPFNETHPDQDARVLQSVYRITKALDPFRPVIDTSGYVHIGQTDIYDAHDYTQDPGEFAKRYEDYLEGRGLPHINHNDKASFDGNIPYFVSEFGGIWWAPGKPGWGYGQAPKSEEEFLARFAGLCDVLLKNPKMCGFCYTQLTDVEQEVNGLYTYERQPKFDPEIIRKIVSQTAAIEK